MKEKIFKTLDEQIEILEEKGLIIEDVDYAKEILFRENYFFISGYRHLFMRHNDKDRFIKGTTFDELYGMFVFDRMIRNIMFKYILIVENNIKSIISYQMSKKYGFKEEDYLNPKNFTHDPLKKRQVRDILENSSTAPACSCCVVVFGKETPASSSRMILRTASSSSCCSM